MSHQTILNTDPTYDHQLYQCQRVQKQRPEQICRLCILHGLDPKIRLHMGECRYDLGGYFIIDGKEKMIIPQEKFADNMFYIKDNYNEIYSHSAEIRSVSEDASKPVRTLSIRIVRPTSKYTNENTFIQEIRELIN